MSEPSSAVESLDLPAPAHHSHVTSEPSSAVESLDLPAPVHRSRVTSEPSSAVESAQSEHEWFPHTDLCDPDGHSANQKQKCARELKR